MKQYFVFFLLLTWPLLKATAQNPLPLKVWQGKADHPMVFYISGDGGMNNFSTNLCADINKARYQVTAMDARNYFWHKKTPEQTTSDISKYLEREMALFPTPRIILVGYSFGADVTPFIVNMMPATLKEKLMSVVMLSPSTSTDFEIHVTDLFGGNSKRSMEVLPAINAMNIPKAAIIFGSDEMAYGKKRVTLRNCMLVTIHGNHHYDGDAQKVASVIIKYF